MYKKIWYVKKSKLLFLFYSMKLKQLAGICLFSLCVLWVKAQDTQKNTTDNVATTLQQDSVVQDAPINPIKITSAYAGQITGLGFSIKDPSDINTYSSTRLWWWASYDMTKTLSLQMMWILDLSPKEWETFAFWQAFLKSKLWKEWVVSTGLLATSATLLRPFPVSWTGHFETSTDVLIPWGGPWFRVDNTSWDVSASAWVALRNWDPEYGANVWYKASTDVKVNLAWWYQNDDVFGVVLSGSYNALSWTLVWNETEDKSLVGAKLLYWIDIPWRTWSLAVFTVANRDLEQPTNSIMNGLAWVLAVDKVNVGAIPMNVVIWPAYDVVNKRVVMYLQVALQK